MGVASFSAGVRMPTRGTFPGCCAIAGIVTDPAAAAPPRSVMKSRRLMCFPQGEDHTAYNANIACFVRWGDRVTLRFGDPVRVCSWQILLQKSFCTRDQNFFWLIDPTATLQSRTITRSSVMLPDSPMQKAPHEPSQAA